MDNGLKLTGAGKGDSLCISGRSDDPVRFSGDLTFNIRDIHFNADVSHIAPIDIRPLTANIGLNANVSHIAPIDIKPLTANIGLNANVGQIAPIAIDIRPLTANVGLNANVSQIAPIDIKPLMVELKIGRMEIKQDNSFVFKLFGFIPLFGFRTIGKINITPL